VRSTVALLSIGGSPSYLRSHGDSLAAADGGGP
jgi:hypothetical protein